VERANKEDDDGNGAASAAALKNIKPNDNTNDRCQWR